jgi:hypothetical protein
MFSLIVLYHSCSSRKGAIIAGESGKGNRKKKNTEHRTQDTEYRRNRRKARKKVGK